MSNLSDTYNLLEQMVEKAEHDDYTALLKLNDLFNKKYSPMYAHKEIEQDVAISYDNCRQSCIFSQTIPEMRDEYLKDARERFSKLPVPKT